MYSLTMARAHPYRGFFWQSVLISVISVVALATLAHHHSHFAPAGIRTMVCLHGTIPRTVSLSLSVPDVGRACGIKSMMTMPALPKPSPMHSEP